MDVERTCILEIHKNIYSILQAFRDLKENHFTSQNLHFQTAHLNLPPTKNFPKLSNTLWKYKSTLSTKPPKPSKCAKKYIFETHKYIFQEHKCGFLRIQRYIGLEQKHKCELPNCNAKIYFPRYWKCTFELQMWRCKN